MRVLVTGANGQVGTELVQQGKSLGLEMIATDCAELDITQQGDVSYFFQIQKPDVVINAAAYTAVDQAELDSELAYAINRDGSAILAQACLKRRIPLFHISTDYIFDGSKEGGYSETDTPNPQSVYGKSKLAGDRAIESILEQHLTLRVSWVFGANGNNFVKTMLRLAKEQDVLKVVSDQYGSPTAAGSIAKTLLNIVKRWEMGKPTPWGTYHYSGQPATTWQGFAKTIFKQAKEIGLIEKFPVVEAITTAEYPTPAIRPLNTMFDCQNIERELGISQPDWHEDLNKVLQTWKAV